MTSRRGGGCGWSYRARTLTAAYLTVVLCVVDIACSSVFIKKLREWTADQATEGMSYDMWLSQMVGGSIILVTTAMLIIAVYLAYGAFYRFTLLLLPWCILAPIYILLTMIVYGYHVIWEENVTRMLQITQLSHQAWIGTRVVYWVVTCTILIFGEHSTVKHYLELRKEAALVEEMNLKISRLCKVRKSSTNKSINKNTTHTKRKTSISAGAMEPDAGGTVRSIVMTPAVWYPNLPQIHSQAAKGDKHITKYRKNSKTKQGIYHPWGDNKRHVMHATINVSRLECLQQNLQDLSHKKTHFATISGIRGLRGSDGETWDYC